MTRYLIATAARVEPFTPLDWHTVEAESRWLAEACAELIAGATGEVWGVSAAGPADVRRDTPTG